MRILQQNIFFRISLSRNKSYKMSENQKRGALVVLEGCDRAGKTTQCKKIVDLLASAGHKARFMNFPDRSTHCGALINSFLTKKENFNDECIHLLFTFNRWEAKEKMEQLLRDGTSLIVDRYSYSGVAFSAAKGLNVEWCKAPEAGLLKPDLVLLLTLTTEAMAKRGGFGDERYEVPELQQKVMEQFLNMKDDRYWHVVDADKNQEQLAAELGELVFNTIESCGHKPLDTLW
ncbi:thymidylate kinase isoform X1 [Topomyia yanbarensis]|uniref:thymidylate kinase isoform X1 n=1 Tax=Topomyia yanbarensis TaxID=2498891 RepID=UPI00273AE4F5|nr:thymidylate kinase isoform X1 [Topomyia yanbarensis]